MVDLLADGASDITKPSSRTTATIAQTDRAAASKIEHVSPWTWRKLSLQPLDYTARPSVPKDIISCLIKELKSLRLAYLHLNPPRVSGEQDVDTQRDTLDPSPND